MYLVLRMSALYSIQPCLGYIILFVSYKALLPWPLGSMAYILMLSALIYVICEMQNQIIYHLICDVFVDQILENMLLVVTRGL